MPNPRGMDKKINRIGFFVNGDSKIWITIRKPIRNAGKSDIYANRLIDLYPER